VSNERWKAISPDIAVLKMPDILASRPEG
jgi:hypothetical protein